MPENIIVVDSLEILKNKEIRENIKNNDNIVYLEGGKTIINNLGEIKTVKTSHLEEDKFPPNYKENKENNNSNEEQDNHKINKSNKHNKTPVKQTQTKSTSSNQDLDIIKTFKLIYIKGKYNYF